jgi:hypothetical protein
MPLKRFGRLPKCNDKKKLRQNVHSSDRMAQLANVNLASTSIVEALSRV